MALATNDSVKSQSSFKGIKPKAWKWSKKGQTLVEYGLILALISVSTLLVLGVMSNSIKNAFDKTITAIVNATS
jgi:Flp pilus assembly pilin Flp